MTIPEIAPVLQQYPSNPSSIKYDEALSIVRDAVWDKLFYQTVGEAVELWMSTLSKLTAANYRSGMRKLEQHKLVNMAMSLQAFAMVNHEAIIDRIKRESFEEEIWSECTRQARAACYISFTGFLSRRFQGLIKKASPCKEGNAKTFQRVHEKVKTNAMSQAQWISFFDCLSQINLRDCLIAKLTLQGAKRINEVLTLRTEQIDWMRREITFKQLKTKGVNKETVITYPHTVMNELHKYIENREGLVFMTRSGKGVPLCQLAKTFARAGRMTNIPFKVSPHVLRASAVTFLKQQGFNDTDIMGVTGHASSAMIYAYDKSSRAENASRKVSLVS